MVASLITYPHEVSFIAKTLSCNFGIAKPLEDAKYCAMID